MWILTAIFSLITTNLIFTRALGTSTMMIGARKLSSLPALALVMTVFSTLACLGMQLVCYTFGLASVLTYPYSLGLPMIYTVMIGVIYLLALAAAGLLSRKKSSEYKKYMHLSAFNCAVMGTLYLAFSPDGLHQGISEPLTVSLFGMLDGAMNEPLSAVLFGLQEGLGFLLAALMLSAVRERLYDTEIPGSFRGRPAMMVYIGIISLAIYAVSV